MWVRQSLWALLTYQITCKQAVSTFVSLSKVGSLRCHSLFGWCSKHGQHGNIKHAKASQELCWIVQALGKQLTGCLQGSLRPPLHRELLGHLEPARPPAPSCCCCCPQACGVVPGSLSACPVAPGYEALSCNASNW
ncbi:hypothetical protein HaLaN_10175, partial [Haematococcus lacustris]